VSFFVIPYAISRGSAEADAMRNGAIMEHMCARPTWFNSPMTEDEIRVTCAWMLTDSGHFKWEIWRGGELVGMLLVSRVSPKVDALFHFTIFPGVPLFGLQKLLHSFLGSLFEGLDLQRISVEIPEQHPKLIRFFRQRLGFLYENEVSYRGHPLAELLSGKDARRLNLHMTEPVPWLARLGARREHAHWDGKEYRDLLLLRLLRSEYQSRSVISPASDEAEAAREQPGSLDVARWTTDPTVRTA
jgi:RimJ/RimL family protein N-acetyltransferase